MTWLYPLGETLLAGLLFLLPGLALLVWLLPELDEDWFAWLSLAAGLSLAIFPVLLLWAWVIGSIRIGSAVLWAMLAICGVFITWRLRHRPDVLRALRCTSPLLAALLMVLAVGVVIIRLWTIRGISTPLWGDSYQHTMMAQLIVDRGGLFDSWLPYAPLGSFTYHYGFHTTVAFFHWLSGVEMPQAVLIVGQLLNALAAFSIYPLAVRLTQNRWVGLMAVVTVAIFSPMPSFYVNWGRYTQLAGQVILPVAVWFTWELVEHPRLSWRRLSLAVVAVAGLALTHYRVLLFYAVILPAWWLVYVAIDRARRAGWLRSLGRLALLAALVLLIIAPWIANTVSSRLAQNQVRTAAIGDRNEFIRSEYNSFGDVSVYVPTKLLGLGGLGVLLSLIRRRSLLVFTGLWIGFLLLLANPYVLHLPGTGVVNNFAVLISLYMPMAIIVGYGLVTAIEYGQRYSRWSPWLGGLLITGLSLWGAAIHVQILDPAYIMVTSTDERAMTWIEANTPPDAKFLVNGFFAYGGSTVVGADAGWWIPLLTKRANTMPPLNYASETPISPGYPRQVRDLVAQIQATNLDAPEGLALLKRNAITHIYIGQGDGRVGNRNAPLLSAKTLLASPYYEPIYHEDQVWIFKVHTELAEEGQ